MRLVIRDRATYRQLPLPEIEVDFDREMLLVAASGGIRTTDHALRIMGVRRAGSMLSSVKGSHLIDWSTSVATEDAASEIDRFLNGSHEQVNVSKLTEPKPLAVDVLTQEFVEIESQEDAG